VTWEGPKRELGRGVRRLKRTGNFAKNRLWDVNKPAGGTIRGHAEKKKKKKMATAKGFRGNTLKKTSLKGRKMMPGKRNLLRLTRGVGNHLSARKC